MYIAAVPNRDSPPAILLRESFREGSKVRTRTLANLSHWPPHRIEAARAKRRREQGPRGLYDVSSTSFEGRRCPLARIGHSRDGRFDRPQIVFGLLTDAQGCPVASDVFDGNTGDPKTVLAQVKKLRERFGLKRVVLVGDRGMITSARIEEDLKQAPGLEWITALRGPAIRKLVETGTLDVSLFDERDL